MKRTPAFVRPVGQVVSNTPDGLAWRVPVVPGILKTPGIDALPTMLQNPDILEKYTHEALRKAPWQVLREFPWDLLRRCLPHTDMRETRRDALAFLLDESVDDGQA